MSDFDRTTEPGGDMPLASEIMDDPIYQTQAPCNGNNFAELQTDTVEIDPDGDATAGRALIPDGIHLYNMMPIDKADYGDSKHSWGAAREKDERGRQKPDGKILWLWTKTDFQINAPKTPFDKAHVFENYVSTMVLEGSGTSRVATLLKHLGVEVPRRASHLDYMNLLIDSSQRRPQIQLETEWQAQCQTCGENARSRGDKYPKPFKYGMRSFPLADSKTGRHSPMVECPVCHNTAEARPQVIRYLAAREDVPF